MAFRNPDKPLPCESTQRDYVITKNAPPYFYWMCLQMLDRQINMNHCAAIPHHVSYISSDVWQHNSYFLLFGQTAHNCHRNNITVIWHTHHFQNILNGFHCINPRPALAALTRHPKAFRGLRRKAAGLDFLAYIFRHLFRTLSESCALLVISGQATQFKWPYLLKSLILQCLPF